MKKLVIAIMIILSMVFGGIAAQVDGVLCKPTETFTPIPFTPTEDFTQTPESTATFTQTPFVENTPTSTITQEPTPTRTPCYPLTCGSG